MANPLPEHDYLYGAAKPEPDGWFNPHRVSTTGTHEGAARRAEVLGEGFVVVRQLVTEWELVTQPERTNDA